MIQAVCRRLVIVGVGLIGGSLARALRQAGACSEIIGCGRNPEHLKQAVDLGVIDGYETDLTTAVRGSDIVVLAVPLGAMPGLLAELAGGIESGTIVTDVGSAKGSVVEAARHHLGQHLPRFVPAHPIAGTEQSGVGASHADLYEGHLVILTPLPETDRQAIERVRRLWETAGARTVTMDVEHHDHLLAATSHLPHMLAFALVDILASQIGDEAFAFAAGGLRDLTRIASSDPRMWTDICKANGTAICDALADYREHLAVLEGLIASRDDEALMALFSRAKSARDRFWNKAVDSDGVGGTDGQ